ncbi:MAG: GNAT family N-acetyltransferase [Candidatus Aenigmatarchaeota archaeon]
MQIRKFKKGDEIKVSNIIRRCLREVNSKDYHKKVITNLCKFFTPSQIIKNSKNRTIFVAIENDKLVGTASLKGDKVFTVFVNSDMHGKGIGSKLMDKIEDLAKKKGYKTIKVPASLTAFEFYKKRGYKKIKIVHSKEHGDTTIEMKKKL